MITQQSEDTPGDRHSRTRLDEVRAYWNLHVDDWKIASHPPGSPGFFEETERYRFEKLDYLPRLVDYSAYAGLSLLDVGCGLGNDASRFVRGGARVTGIDLAPRAVDLCRRNFAQRGLKGEFLEMDGEAMRFADEQFDVVYCHTVLHFTPRPDRMIDEIHRVLRPGGTAILMAVNRRSWLFLLQGLLKTDIDYADAPVFHRLTRGDFQDRLKAFDEVDMRVERFPVPTRVHHGLRAVLFNAGFVGTFNALPRRLTGPLGHHLLAFCRKAQR